MSAHSYGLVDLLRRNAALHADQTAFIIEEGVSHAQHWMSVQRLAAGLASAGLRAGDCIGLLSKNRLACAELMGAVACLGATLSLINWRLSAAEVQAVLENDAPRMLVVELEFKPLVEAAMQSNALLSFELVGVGGVASDWPGYRTLEAITANGGTAVPPDAPPDLHPLLLIHTAWTDGRPKAAMLSQSNLLASALQLQNAWQLGTQDVYLACLPLFHITAVSLMLSTQLAGGTTLISPNFTPAQASQQIAAHHVTVLAEFAPMLQGLLDDCDNDPARLASLRHLCGLDAPATIERLAGVCPEATFWTAYGQTEISGLATLGPFREMEGSVGRPLSLCSVQIEDEFGRPLPAGETGEITVRGPTTCAGYLNRPKDSERLLRGGWLHTGDLGRLDAAGRLWYLGRLPEKELIKSGGENVYPAEIEAVLLEHPDIMEAVVIGVSDARWGETVKAVCVPRSNPPPSAEAISDFVGQRIARYKRPRIVTFVQDLPRKADGSTDRDAVKRLPPPTSQDPY